MTLLRTLLLLAFITAISLALASLADSPGQVVIDWRGRRIETSLLFLIGATGALGFAIILAVASLRRLFTIPKRYVGVRQERRYEQGLAILTEALAAIALSDTTNARKQSDRAAKLLGNAPVVHLLQAQLSRLEGDEPQTRRHLEELLKNPLTEFAATRGLLEAARRKEDWESVAVLGQKALSMRPNDHWSVLSMLDAHLRRKQWQDALGLLERAWRKRAISRDEHTRYYALTHYLHGQGLFKEGQYSQAENSLQYANRRLPAFAPATALLARTQARRGNPAAAMKTLIRGWKLSPHPDVADVFFELTQKEKNSQKLVAAAERLTGANPIDNESLLLLARACTQAGQTGPARKHLQKIVEREPMVRAYRMLAEIEQTHDAGAAENWRAKAAQTDRDYAWLCSSCGHSAFAWVEHCSGCGSFDSFQWRLQGSNTKAFPI